MSGSTGDRRPLTCRSTVVAYRRTLVNSLAQLHAAKRTQYADKLRARTFCCDEAAMPGAGRWRWPGQQGVPGSPRTLLGKPKLCSPLALTGAAMRLAGGDH